MATYGSASTGTAIVGLSGAAAQNATMAWLGGGGIAAGGGMALSAVALNFVTIGPTMLVGGLVFNGKGDEKLTKAREYVVSTPVLDEDSELDPETARLLITYKAMR